MSTGTLYEASQTYQAAWDLVYDSAIDGLITPDLKCIIDSVQDDLNSKLETFATLVTELESDAEQCKKEAARLAGRAKWFREQIGANIDQMAQTCYGCAAYEFGEFPDHLVDGLHESFAERFGIGLEVIWACTRSEAPRPVQMREAWENLLKIWKPELDLAIAREKAAFRNW